MQRFMRCVRGRASSRATLLALVILTMPTARAADCDRDCLAGMITRYVDALVAHDPSRLPLAENVRFTEDSRELDPGQGLWQTVTGRGDFRQDYLDVRRQIAASHVVVLEENAQVLYSVLLRIADRKISGIETLVDRVTPDSRFKPTMLGKPLPGLGEPVPAGKTMSRAAMIRTALRYPAGLRVGSFVEADTPFADEAYRVENGSYMAGTAICPREQCPDILTQNIIEHPDVMPSVAAVDEELGNVLLWMNFGDTNSYGPGNALVTFEAFKVWGDEIHAVNAFFRILPKETQRGWQSAE
jgi:hypothetical protein